MSSLALYYRHFHVLASRPARASRPLPPDPDGQPPGHARDDRLRPRALARARPRAHATGARGRPGHARPLWRIAWARRGADPPALRPLRRPAYCDVARWKWQGV